MNQVEWAIICLTRIRPVKKTVDQYVKRWRIECLFRHLKTNGFNLEAINFQLTDKSNLMMAIVGLSYGLTIRAGWAARAVLRMVSYGDGTVFPAECIFRKRLSLITPWCSSLALFVRRLTGILNGSDHALIRNVE